MRSKILSEYKQGAALEIRAVISSSLSQVRMSSFNVTCIAAIRTSNHYSSGKENL